MKLNPTWKILVMETKSLIELCIPEKSAMYGIPASAEEYDLNKIRYLRISDISDDGVLLNDDMKSVSSEGVEKYILKEGDIVFARTGNSTGRAYYHESKNGDLAYAGFLIKFSLDNKKVNPKYLRYYTVSNQYREWVENFSLGSTRGNLNAKSFSECPIPLPSRKAQDDLVKVLSDLDAKIELNNKINSELESMAKLIYDYWFVQFDFPDENGKPYKSSGGKMIYNEELKREIPEGWRVKEIQELAFCIMGQSPKGKSYNQDGIGTPLINGPADYENGGLKAKTFTTEPTRLCKKDDMVLCIRATIGNLVYSEKEFCLGRGVAAVRPLSSELSEYVYYLLEREIEVFKVRATGSIIKGITKEDLVSAKVPVPNSQKIKSFSNNIKPHFDKIRLNKNENKILTELRDWLLPMLMNGQVTVK